MAEGLLDGVLGGEEERIDPTSGGAEPIVAAVAATLASRNPEVAAETAAMFRKQTEVLEVQKRSLEAEHEFFEAEWAPRLLALRLRAGFQIFVVLVAAVIGLGVAVMVHDAFTSRSVVVEPFHTPPVLAANGIDGTVVAAGLLDEISRLQAATRSTAERRELTNAWTNDVKLAVPETGVSLGDISRMLRARFGHDLHLYGDLVSTVGGLSLTVRGDGVAPKTFAGTSGDLARLTTEAAEYVYAQAEPALWAYYLVGMGRNQEAIIFCQTAYSKASDQDRPYLLNVWANALANTGGDSHQALKLYRAALKIKPNFWIGYNNVINSHWALGEEESAWRAGEELRQAAGGRPGAAPETEYQNWDTLTWNLPAWHDAMIADARSGGGTNITAEGPAIAIIEARLHDMAAAELALGTTTSDEADPTIAAMTHFVRGQLAVDAGDTERAVTEMEAFGIGYSDPVVRFNYPGYSCWIAPAEEAAGHPDKADAVLRAAGTFVDCYRFRADILDGRSDWTGAQKAYAEAVALAPDLPAAYYSWGVALLKHGELDGAATKFGDSNHRGPHWADPLKAWGDVLLQQGKTKDALAKYNDALNYAPNWKQLRDARDALAKQKAD